jgi:hypothetical protein
LIPVCHYYHFVAEEYFRVRKPIDPKTLASKTQDGVLSPRSQNSLKPEASHRGNSMRGLGSPRIGIAPPEEDFKHPELDIEAQLQAVPKPQPNASESANAAPVADSSTDTGVVTAGVGPEVQNALHTRLWGGQPNPNVQPQPHPQLQGSLSQAELLKSRSLSLKEVGKQISR